MQTFSLRRDQRLGCERGEVFSFFADPSNLEAITPPFLHFRVVRSTTPLIEEGTEIEYRLRVRGVPIRWVSRITTWDPPHVFVDEQLEGPYRRWHHTHRFFDEGGATRVEDEVLYAVPAPGALGRLVDRLLIRPDLERIFDHRMETIARLLAPPRRQ